MRAAKEMPARTNFADRIQRQFGIIDNNRAQKLRHHVEQVRIQHHFFKRGVQPAFHPSSTMHQQIDPAHHRRPQRKYAFIGRLRVQRIGGIGVG